MGWASERMETENTTSTTFYVGNFSVFLLHWLGAGVTESSTTKVPGPGNDEEGLELKVYLYFPAVETEVVFTKAIIS